MSQRMHSNWLFHWIAGVLTLALVSSPLLAVAAAPKPAKPSVPGPLKVGDRAVWDFGNKEYPGTVESIDPNNGWVTLKLDSNEFGGKHRSPANFLRKIAKKPAKAKSADKAKNADPNKPAANPFETTEEKLSKLGSRTWSDQSGKFKVEASLIKYDGAQVTLKRTDGKEVVLAISKLSDADQKFLKENVESTALPDEETEKGEAPAEEAVAEIEVVDASGAPPLDVGATSTWSYTPDAAVEQKVPPTRIALGDSSTFEKDTLFFVSPETSKAVVVWLDTFSRKSARVQQCDLLRKKVEKTAEFMAGQTPIALSGDLSRVLAQEFDRDSKGALHLYEIEANKLKPRTAWQPHAGEKRNVQKVESARFVSKDLVLTQSDGGAIVLWKVANAPDPQYQVIQSSGKPSFTAGGKYFAALVEGGIVILETMTGKKVGFLPIENHAAGLLAFDPAGRQLALLYGKRLRVWDLATRESTADFDCGTASAEQFLWTDENTLLIGDTVLDVTRRIPIWHYTGRLNGTVVGGRYYYVSARRPCILASGQIPSEEARDFVKKLNSEELQAFKPGDSVSLDVQLGNFPQHREKVIVDLKKQLEANGMKVADESELKLVVNVTPGEVKTLEFRGFRGGFNTEKHAVATQKTSVAYQLKGQTIWDTAGEISPGFISAKKDETVDAAINRQISESVAGLGSTSIPKSVSILPAGTKIGSSLSP